MNITKRYSFRRVFSLMTVVYLLFIIIELVALVMMKGDREVSLIGLLREINFLNQGLSLLFNAAFLFFTINAFYWRLADRVRSHKFLKPVVVGVLAQYIYLSLMFYLLKDDNLIFSDNGIKARDQLPDVLMLVSYLMSAFFFTSVSFIIAFITSFMDERAHNKVLKEQKMQLEIEKTQANYKFLKAQINPHFLHNTLSFLYARSLPCSPEVAEGILTLSHIMRYALSEGNAIDGKVPLQDEIEHVRHVIRINQLRFSNKLHVQLEVEGDISGGKIIPFVLITLVENALKHGDMKCAACPILFRVRVEGKKFCFYSHNKKKTGAKELSTGIGLSNIQKRLKLEYGDNCHFQINDEAEFYTTHLTIAPL